MGSNKLSDHPVIVILGLISACIAIFAFVTGFQSLRDLFSNTNSRSNDGQSSEPFTPIPNSKPTPIEIVSGTWTQVGLPEDTISDIKMVSDNLMYVSTWGFQHGIFKTEDGGKQWSAINNGLGGLNVIEMALMNSDGSIIVAGSDEGVWGTRNGGQSWQAMASKHPQSDDYIYGISTISNQVYIVVEANWGSFVSTDFGSTWQSIEYNDLFWNASLYHISTAQSTIYLTGRDNIYRSDDAGTTWNLLAHVGQNYPIADIRADPTSASIVYVCAGQRSYNREITFSKGNGLYISKDGGGSWSPINNGLPNQGNDTECSEIAINPNNGSQVFLGMNGQVFFSENRGESWKQLSTLPTEIGSVTSIAVLGNKICIGTNTNGIWCILQ